MNSEKTKILSEKKAALLKIDQLSEEGQSTSQKLSDIIKVKAELQAQLERSQSESNIKDEGLKLLKKEIVKI